LKTKNCKQDESDGDSKFIAINYEPDCYEPMEH
jgi:hypothetical protein